MTWRGAVIWLAAFYRGLAVFVLNTLVLIVVAHLAVWAWFRAHPPPFLGSWAAQEVATLGPRAYPGRSPEEIRALLTETWSRPVEYHPFVQFKERMHRGRFVNVSADGFRHIKNQGPWPPSRDDFNVFVFGGSTTFGYGVADAETIPSFLQEQLEGRTPRPPRVYNFGCAFYYSSQERVRFEQLIIGGFVPDLAVFVDALNEFHIREEWPWISSPLHDYVEGKAAQRRSGVPPWLTLFSPERLAAEMRGLRRPGEAPSTDPQLADRLIDRYLHNKKVIEAIAGAYRVPVVFVWQPVSVYRFDWKRHHRPNLKPNPLPRVGAERMAERLKGSPLGPAFIWAADIQGEVADPLYVDGVHYAPNLCRAIARLAADEMETGGFLRPATGSAASGR